MFLYIKAVCFFCVGTVIYTFHFLFFSAAFRWTKPKTAGIEDAMTNLLHLHLHALVREKTDLMRSHAPLASATNPTRHIGRLSRWPQRMVHGHSSAGSSSTIRRSDLYTAICLWKFVPDRYVVSLLSVLSTASYRKALQTMSITGIKVSSSISWHL